MKRPSRNKTQVEAEINKPRRYFKKCEL